MSTVSRLRAATASLHDAVDAAFGGHDLNAIQDYTRFLIAHALALPAAERRFAATAALPPWRERTTALTEDLADLGHAMPAAMAFALPDRPGAAWGALYVTEGSRLGGIMLARSVNADLPARYLKAKHESGEWRALLAAIDAEGEVRGDAWIDAAIEGAEACFALYRHAARTVAG
jgi:heme oxygenase